MPQLGAVIGVFVARRDGQHPQPQHLLLRMLDAAAIAPVAHRSRKPGGKPKSSLDVPQQHHAAIRRQHAAIEANAHLLAPNRWKFEGKYNRFTHDGCGAPSIDRRFGLTNRIMSRNEARRYIRRSISLVGVNKTG